MLGQLPFKLLLSKILPSFAAIASGAGLCSIASLGFTVAAQLPASAASLTPVNVELSLLIDVSGSIDSREYAL